MAGEEFMHGWPLHMEHIAEQINPTLTQPLRFPHPDLQLHICSVNRRQTMFVFSILRHLAVLLLAKFEFESRLDNCVVEML